MTQLGDQPSGATVEPAATLGALNAKVRARQRLLLLGGGGAAALAALWFVFGGQTSEDQPDEGPAQQIDTSGLVNRDLSQKEFVAIYGNRLDAQARQLKSLEESQARAPAELEARLDELAAEAQAMKADGARTIDALSAENETLRRALEHAEAAPEAPDPADPAEPPPEREVKMLSFAAANEAASPPAKEGVGAARPEARPLLGDSPDYLPPNSYAPARVIVGVDASAGVASQTDPLPVVLRITGPARSVVKDGRLLMTRIEGCIVNGAARGDLSAEKVYVKLAKMTCDQPGGRVAVSEVKGFISFAGKTGVRGRVVSREGNLVTQALLAGIAGGFGRGFSANANSLFSGFATGPDGRRQPLSGGEIVEGGVGQGIGEAADTVSRYLIERAEQYQPVIEMPTGIEVEIVFLEGVQVRASQ